MFKITIEETKTEEVFAGKEWEKTGKEEPAYAYTPEIKKHKDVTRQIYEQTVEDLNIQKVIIAVNDL